MRCAALCCSALLFSALPCLCLCQLSYPALRGNHTKVTNLHIPLDYHPSSCLDTDTQSLTYLLYPIPWQSRNSGLSLRAVHRASEFLFSHLLSVISPPFATPTPTIFIHSQHFGILHTLRLPLLTQTNHSSSLLFLPHFSLFTPLNPSSALLETLLDTLLPQHSPLPCSMI
jgi:hypothetical protein